MTTIGRTLDNRYILREKIGSGGFGAVYLAEDTRFTGNNLVAIKQIAQIGELSVKAFHHEANLLYNLSHPNLPKVTNCFQEIEANYIVMDFIAGEDLMAQLRRGRRFSVSEVLKIADTVLDALEYLHSFLIFHRDIKPHNIKIDESGKLFLLDFGTAKGQEDETAVLLTNQSITGYTPFYAPLEQILRVDANSYLTLQSIQSPNLDRFVHYKTDARSDIYSLGATVYQLLTGVSPERATATIRAHLLWSGNPDPLPDSRSYNREISERLAAVIEKCLAIDPEERFQTAAQLRTALQMLELTGSAIENPRLDSLPVEKPESSPFINFNLPDNTMPAPTTAENLKTKDTSPPSPPKMPTKIMVYAGLSFAFLILIGLVGGWFALSGSRETPKTSPTVAGQPTIAETAVTTATPSNRRSFTYSLLVQKMRDGKNFQAPFASSGQEIFESGYKFQMRFTPPGAGFLYVFNEGLDEKGEKIFSIQFPTPEANNGIADVAANQSYQSRGGKFDGMPGTENFWIVWSVNKIEPLEKARDNAFQIQNEGVVADADLKSKLKDYLENERKNKIDVSKDVEKKLTRIDFEDDVLVYLLHLEHR